MSTIKSVTVPSWLAATKSNSNIVHSIPFKFYSKGSVHDFKGNSKVSPQICSQLHCNQIICFICSYKNSFHHYGCRAFNSTAIKFIIQDGCQFKFCVKIIVDVNVLHQKFIAISQVWRVKVFATSFSSFSPKTTLGHEVSDKLSLQSNKLYFIQNNSSCNGL